MWLRAGTRPCVRRRGQSVANVSLAVRGRLALVSLDSYTITLVTHYPPRGATGLLTTNGLRNVLRFRRPSLAVRSMPYGQTHHQNNLFYLSTVYLVNVIPNEQIPFPR